MLGRAANDLYWMARYIERAENMARLLEVSYRLVLVPHEHRDQEWQSTLRSAGCEDSYLEKHPEIETDTVVHYLLSDNENPSSIYSCISKARHNARAQRTALTRDMWESLNSTWIELVSRVSEPIADNELPTLFDWIKERSALFRGMMLNTILRNDTYFFIELGTFLERADNTARILDVKYYVLLPQNQFVGGGIDTLQWQAILRSVSAHKSYQWVYKDGFTPWSVADYLILKRQMPRSLRACYDAIVEALSGLETYYESKTNCRLSAVQMGNTLASRNIDSIFNSGMHEFLFDFISHNAQLSDEISQTYHFID